MSTLSHVGWPWPHLPLACIPRRWTISFLLCHANNRNTGLFSHGGGSLTAGSHTPRHSPPVVEQTCCAVKRTAYNKPPSCQWLSSSSSRTCEALTVPAEPHGHTERINLSCQVQSQHTASPGLHPEPRAVQPPLSNVYWSTLCSHTTAVPGLGAWGTAQNS